MKKNNFNILSLTKFIHTIISFIPLGVYILFLSFVVNASLILGHLPSYDNPDPRSLGFRKFYYFVFCSFDWAIIASLLWILLLVISNIYNLYKLNRLVFFIGVLGIVLHFISLIIDPLGLELWFFD